MNFAWFDRNWLSVWSFTSGKSVSAAFSAFVFAIAAIVVGLLAAIFPARRAARLNVLEALQYE